MLVIELRQLESLSGGRHVACNHVCELAGGGQESTAVVANVEHEIDQAWRTGVRKQLIDRVD